MRERGSVEDTEGREFVYINVFAYLYESGSLYGMNALMYFYIYILYIYRIVTDKLIVKSFATIYCF